MFTHQVANCSYTGEPGLPHFVSKKRWHEVVVARSEKRWLYIRWTDSHLFSHGCRCKSDCRCHLFTGLPITHHGLSAIDTKSAHGVPRHEVKEVAAINTGCDSHLFWRGGCGHHSGRHEVEVAVHLNGQTAMRKVARSGEVRSEKRYEVKRGGWHS
jgi:hypothetical protein